MLSCACRPRLSHLRHAEHKLPLVWTQSRRLSALSLRYSPGSIVPHCADCLPQEGRHSPCNLSYLEQIYSDAKVLGMLGSLPCVLLFKLNLLICTAKPPPTWSPTSTPAFIHYPAKLSAPSSTARIFAPPARHTRCAHTTHAYASTGPSLPVFNTFATASPTPQPNATSCAAGDPYRRCVITCIARVFTPKPACEMRSLDSEPSVFASWRWCRAGDWERLRR